MNELLHFRNRVDAGQRLAAKLEPLRGEGPLILGLARGGVVVAAEVAKRWGAELDVVVARKIRCPGHPELAIGAVAGNVVRLDERTISMLGIPAVAVANAVRTARVELERREAFYRVGRVRVPIEGRTVIVIDDGLATGWTARATLEALRQHHPRRLVFAAPVCAPQSIALLRGLADPITCLCTPDDLRAVSLWYDEFPPTTDQEVLAILDEALTGAKGPGQ
jgi:predicted phosphoribosyltransferase